MKLLFIIFSLTLYLNTNHTVAQSIAIMQASVHIVSGSSIESIQNNMDVYMKSDLNASKMELRVFKLTSAANTDIDTRFEHFNPEQSSFKTLTMADNVMPAGTHEITLGATIKNSISESPQTDENILMIVEYY